MDRVKVMETVVEFQKGRINRRQFLTRSAALIGSAAAATTLLAACQTNGNENPPPVVDAEATATRAATATAVATATIAPTVTAEPVVESPTEIADPTATIEPTETMEPTPEPLGAVVGQEVTYPGPSGSTLMGYLAYQEGDLPRPVVVVIQEWWGLNEHIKEVADRFAGEGFIAIAPDLYNGVVTTEPDEARKQAIALDIANAVQEIGAAIEFAQAQPFATDKAGVTGFCMGGLLTYQSAANLDNVDAAAAFYGNPLSPADAENVTIPLQTFLGTADGISSAAVQAMHDVLDSNGVTNVFNLYDGAPHAFFNDTRASYRPEAADDAWLKTVEWFRTHLA